MAINITTIPATPPAIAPAFVFLEDPTDGILVLVGEEVLELGEEILELEEDDAGRHEVSLPVAMKNGEVCWLSMPGTEP